MAVRLALYHAHALFIARIDFHVAMSATCSLNTSKNSFDICFLPERWRLDRHPLYPNACRRLGLSAPIETPLAETNGNEDLLSNIQVAAYQRIEFPRDSAVQYSRLMQDFKQLIAVAQDSPNLYKRTRIAIASLLSIEDH